MAKKLAVIDGKSVFYRGYYAMPNLAAADGAPTGGVYGFAVLALQVLKKLKPDYVIVAWDKPKTNIRSRRKLYEQYKANRKPMPDDMREQIPILRQLLEAFSWPLLECDDFEADDIMATIARQASKKGVETILVTSDLDVLQAVDGDSSVYALKRGLTDVVHYDRDKFTAEYSMTPEQFIDYKALKGDSSDNVPGVAGVGDKTARDLMQKFGSLDNIYQHLDEIPDKLRAKLEKAKDMAYLSHKLLEIQFNAPVKLDLNAADVLDAKPAAIAELFNKLEFRRLLGELPAQMQAQQEIALPKPVKGKVSVVSVERVETPEKLEQLVKQSPAEITLFSFFKEIVAGLPQLREVLLSFDGKTAYIISPSLKLSLKDIVKILKPLLEDPKVGKIGFDIKSDIKAWLSAGVSIQPVSFDVMVAAMLLNPLLRIQTLEQLALDELGLKVPPVDRTTSIEEVSGGLITSALTQMHAHFKNRLSKLPKVAKLAADIEWPVTSVLARMEYRGIKLDGAYLKKMSKRFGERIEQIKKTIYKEAKEEFNISSPQQLSKVLFESLQLPLKSVKRTKTGISTAAGELDKLRGLHPIIDLITEYRELSKLRSTYVDPLPALVDSHSRLHTTFNQIGSQTGRLSSDHPNLMNIPVRTQVGREIRRAFVAGPGNVLISADYSQFELRLAAVLSEDENMLTAFNKGIDIHQLTAAEMYDIEAKEVTKDQRYSAKAVNFGVLYGMSAHGLSVAAGMSRDEAQVYIDQYFAIRKKLHNYLNALKDKAKKDGYVETLFGRRRPMPDIKSSNFVVRSAAERAAMNMPIQGTEADLMKLAMIKIDQKFDDDCHMLLQIHDSILVECSRSKAKKVAKTLENMLQNVYKLPVKLEVDVSTGSNWGEL